MFPGTVWMLRVCRSSRCWILSGCVDESVDGLRRTDREEGGEACLFFGCRDRARRTSRPSSPAPMTRMLFDGMVWLGGRGIIIMLNDAWRDCIYYIGALNSTWELMVVSFIYTYSENIFGKTCIRGYHRISISIMAPLAY